MFVIGYEGVTKGFYAVDEMGYSYCTSNLSSAKMFDTMDEAKEVIDKDPEFNRKCVMSNGTVYPPAMIHKAADLCNTRMSGSVTFKVMEIKLDTVCFKIFFGEIKTK